MTCFSAKLKLILRVKKNNNDCVEGRADQEWRVFTKAYKLFSTFNCQYLVANAGHKLKKQRIFLVPIAVICRCTLSYFHSTSHSMYQYMNKVRNTAANKITTMITTTTNNNNGVGVGNHNIRY